MQRYSASNCGSGFTNAAVGGTSARENPRSDSFSSSNYPLNSRRALQLTPYKLKCEKEPLNCRLGPPDFIPQTPNCPEETLTREYLSHGYKETVEGIEEAREIVLSQIGLSKPAISKFKEAIKKRLRAINDSRAQKRKAGQVYGAPLSGQLLVKPGIFPEQKQLAEDSRKKWIEGLSQQHKRLRSLADFVPHGYRKKGLLDVIIRQNVPLLRATWFIKVTYLNQVRPAAAGVPSGTPDKTQFVRTELWTKDLVEYLQSLLDDFVANDGFSPHNRDQTPRTTVSGLPRQRNDTSPSISSESDLTVQFNWNYMLRLLQWHYAEGLISPSFIIEWVLGQLQEKDSVDILELLVPIIVDMIDSMALSQIYVRSFVEIVTRVLHNISPETADFRVNTKQYCLVSMLVEVLRYLLLVAPDAFVALDCFPLPVIVAPDVRNGAGSFLTPPLLGDKAGFGSEDAYCCYLSYRHVTYSLWRRASILSKIATTNVNGQGVAKVVQALDKAVVDGDSRGAYSSLFEELSDATIKDYWIAEVNPFLRSSLKWIGAVEMSVIYAVFFVCEWATCDFRDFRDALPLDVKFSGRKDFCQVYLAVSLLKIWMEDTCVKGKNASSDNYVSDKMSFGNDYEHGRHNKGSKERDLQDIFQSPSPIHDIVVCWLDQHEIGKGEGLKRVEILLMELIRHGMFYPHIYVRQLIVSGVMDQTGSPLDFDRQRRHCRVLRQLPGLYLFDVLEEPNIAGEEELLHEVVHVYSNERNLVLNGSFRKRNGCAGCQGSSIKEHKNKFTVARGNASPPVMENHKALTVSSSPSDRKGESKSKVLQLKAAISTLLHFPHACSPTIETQCAESRGSLKRSFGSIGSKLDLEEGRPDYDDCVRAKLQKTANGRIPNLRGVPPTQADDEDNWWLKKGPKYLEPFRTDKPTKQTSRGRQKSVRKTQSLAQLAAARIESSQGASTSHVCDKKLSCPHQQPGFEGEIPNFVSRGTLGHLSDIGRALKSLRWVEKRSIAIWLLRSIRLLIEHHEKSASKLVQCNNPFSPSVEDESGMRWKLGEDDLSSVLYLLDTCSDLYSLAKFLLWLSPKILNGSSDPHLGRNAIVLPRSKENPVVSIGESFLLSSLQRYEKVLVVTDLLPEVLDISMDRIATILASSGRASASLTLVYARNLIKKYGNATSIVMWERDFKATCDPRLLAEIDGRRPQGGDIGHSLGIPAEVEDLDEYLRQKICLRIPRVAQIMKDIVQKNIEDAMLHLHGKDRKLLPANADAKVLSLEKWDHGYQIAHKIVLGLLECFRQNGGTSQEVDPSLVAAVVSAIVSSIGTAISKFPELASSGNSQNASSTMSWVSCVRGIVNILVACICLLKEALGERMNRMFEIALAAEASSYISGIFSSGKVQRGHFQLSPEAIDVSSSYSSDILNSSTKLFSSRASKIAASVSAFIIGIIVRGVFSLERMISVFKLKEGLDIVQFIKSARSSTNGVSRSTVHSKLDYCIETHIHWFRLLVGNCRTVFDGLVIDILGESYALALSRMQHMLQLNLVFPPAYSIFAMIIWRPYIHTNIASREDNQLYQFLLAAISDAIRHQPFRDLCLRDTRAFYELISSDFSKSESEAIVELHSLDKHVKAMAFVPLRARLFLNAIVDAAMPSFTLMKDDGSGVSGQFGHAENETKLLGQLVHVLDTLQPAKFHWQWVELRLLLNEQALIEKIEGHNMSIVEALHSLSSAAENDALSENEDAFTDIVLTRLLVRPDAASLYSEVFHLLGRSFEDKLLLHAKWFLAGNDVLLGRKSVRQRLIDVAQRRVLSTKSQYWKPWGWSSSLSNTSGKKIEKRKLEPSSFEEGEVIEEGGDARSSVKSGIQMLDGVGYNKRQYPTDKALAELVLPCIDRSSAESRAAFVAELIKQMNAISQHINSLTRGASKHSVVAPSGNDGTSSKSSRKGIRVGSPGIGRRSTGAKDSIPSSATALRASIWLRLQFILRLIPLIYSDREPSSRNLRNNLATILLHLLGTQVVYNDVETSFLPMQRNSSRKELEAVGVSNGNSLDHSGDCLFDMMLAVLYGLLSGCTPSWLKSRSSKSNSRSSRDFSAVDREVLESLQADLDCMHLPVNIRRRLQAAIPMLPSPPSLSVSCAPQIISSASRSSLQHIMLMTGLNQGNSNSPQRSVHARSASSRSKSLPSHDPDIEIDPWTLLEDGVGSVCCSSNNNSLGGSGNDQSNLKAAYWLKGAVRVRRTDLSYIGVMDDGS